MLLMNPQCGSRNLPLTVCIYYTFNTRSLGISVHAVDMENPTDGSRLSKLCWTPFSGLYFYLEVIFLPLRLEIKTSSRVLVVTDVYDPRWLEICLKAHHYALEISSSCSPQALSIPPIFITVRLLNLLQVPNLAKAQVSHIDPHSTGIPKRRRTTTIGGVYRTKCVVFTKVRIRSSPGPVS
jgi:hypothetical protein